MGAVAWAIQAFSLEVFGQYALVESVIRVVDLLFGLGSPLWIRKSAATTLTSDSSEISNIAAVIRRFFVRGILTFLPVCIAVVAMGPLGGGFAVPLAVLSIPFAIANRQLSALLAARGLAIIAATTQPVIRLLSFVAAINLAADTSPAPLIVASSVTSIVSAAILVWRGGRSLGTRFAPASERLPYSVFAPFHIRELVNAGFEYLVVLVVGAAGSAALAGTSRVFSRARLISLVCYTALAQVLQRRLGHLVARRDFAALRRLLAVGAWVSVGSALLAQVGLLSIGGFVLPLAGIGGDWATRGALHLYLASSIIIGFFFALPLVADFLGLEGFQARLIGAVRVVQLGAIAVLTGSLGIFGFAAPLLAGVVAIYLLTYRAVRREVNQTLLPEKVSVRNVRESFLLNRAGTKVTTGE